MVRVGARLAAVLLALLAACAHGPPPSRRAARLEVQASPAGVRPYLRATVAGRPVRLVVDTGATRSTLPAALARELGLRIWSSESDDRVVDANGLEARMGTVKDVPLQLEGEALPTKMDFLANPAREAVPLLAPQDLVRSGWAVVIDLERRELALEPEAEALARTGRDGAALRETAFRNCAEEGLFNRLHRIVPAAVNGVPAQLLVDTGASHTALLMNNPAARSLATLKARRAPSAALSSTLQLLAYEGVPVEFAGATFTGRVAVLPSTNACWDGALGADVLRHCTLVWAWSSLRVACHPATHPE